MKRIAVVIMTLSCVAALGACAPKAFEGVPAPTATPIPPASGYAPTWPLFRATQEAVAFQTAIAEPPALSHSYDQEMLGQATLRGGIWHISSLEALDTYTIMTDIQQGQLVRVGAVRNGEQSFICEVTFTRNGERTVIAITQDACSPALRLPPPTPPDATGRVSHAGTLKLTIRKWSQSEPCMTSSYVLDEGPYGKQFELEDPGGILSEFYSTGRTRISVYGFEFHCPIESDRVILTACTADEAMAVANTGLHKESQVPCGPNG